MAIEVRKRKGENTQSLIYRFGRRVRRSGILAEMKRRKFRQRPKNKRRQREDALYSKKRQEEMAWARKMGEL